MMLSETLCSRAVPGSEFQRREYSTWELSSSLSAVVHLVMGDTIMKVYNEFSPRVYRDFDK